MKKISNVLQELVEENHFVKVGLSYKLFNLTQLAFFLQPLLETRLKKKIKVSAIVMNLSRYQRGLLKQGQFNSDFKIKTLTVHGNLFTASFSKTPSVHKEANDFYEFLNREGSFVTVTDSGKEITIIAEAKYIDEMKNFIEVDPVNLVENISGIAVQFDDSYIQIPGFLHAVLQRVTLQHINVVEVASTHTVFMVYVHKKDTKLAFDTLLNCF